MKVIVSRQGDEIIVDDNWYELLSRFTWYTSDGRGYKYAKTGFTNKGNPKGLAMHRIVTSAPRGSVVDHINGNTLDNRSSNLRLATRSENGMNRFKLSSNNTSGRTGVAWSKQKKKWIAFVEVNKKRIHLGSYTDKSAAITARSNGELKHFGEFANNGNRGGK